MFLTFQKITTATPSKKSKILVNSESILLMDQATFENKELGTQYQATRVEVVGTPNHTFYTLTDLDNVLTYVPFANMTAPAVPGGTQCGGDAGALSYITPSFQVPLIKALSVLNNSPTESREYVFNPNFIVYAEEVIYYSQGNIQQTALMISLRDNQTRQILTRMTLADLITLIEPIEVISP